MVFKPTSFVLAAFAVLWTLTVSAQKTVTVKGKVFSKDEVDHTGHDHGPGEGREEENWLPLPGAYVVWKSTGEGTSTDAHGFFRLEGVEGDTLVASFIGMTTAELPFIGQSYVEIPLGEGFQLNEAQVVAKGPTTSVSLLDPLVVQSLGRDELCRAACCNLSEAFETNAAVDASFTDAVTGTKQIRMLGLDGKYTQMMFDNQPGARGLNILQGMKFIPGEWVDQIHIGKGAGSVTLGHESMTGQINVSLRDADIEDKFIVNGFLNRAGRYELNTVSRHAISRKWRAALLTHGEWADRVNDRNADGFQDNALSKDLVLRSEWQYTGDRGLKGEYTVTAVSQEKESGQLPLLDAMTDGLWMADQAVDRVVATAKTGYVFPGDEGRSLGSQLTVGNHDQTLSFGPYRSYIADQQFARLNLLHQMKTGRGDDLVVGLSAKGDRYDQSLLQDGTFPVPGGSATVRREEATVGAFAEWTVKREQWDVILGLRSDVHDTFGLFVTPRLNARWSVSDAISLKAAAGKGWRTSVPLAEFAGVWASNRTWIFPESGAVDPFRGLQPEESWNLGLNLLSKFTLGYRDASFSLDGYRVDFSNRVFVDLDTPGEGNQRLATIRQGRSQSRSVQAEFWWDWTKRLDITLAYRWVDASSDYGDFSGYRQDPFVAQHRGFTTVAYGSRPDAKGRQWRADVTFQVTGPQRLPWTSGNDIVVEDPRYVRPSEAPTFVTGNVQISRDFAEGQQIYVGVENVTDYRQAEPIVGIDYEVAPGEVQTVSGGPIGDDPLFDAAIVYAPIFGRNVYAGVRWAFGR